MLNYIRRINLKLLTKTIIATFLASVAFNTTAAVSLNVTNGILMGANNVDVDGVLYNVEFTDDDTTATMPPSTSFDARAASQALLDHVLVGEFDDKTHLTNGCGFDGFCMISTISSVDSLDTFEYVVWNYGGAIYGTVPDEIFTAINMTSAASNNLSGGYTHTNARWTVTAVPEPSSVALLLVGGLTALGFSRRKK